MPFLPENLQDWVETVATGAGVLGALVVFSINARTAHRELMRRYAEAGRSLINEMCDDRDVKNAFAILDAEANCNATLEDEHGNSVTSVEIKRETALRTLSPEHANDGGTAELVRDGFDSLFYYFASFEHSIVSRLVQLKDVAYPAAYYIRLMSEDKKGFVEYLNRHQMNQANAFLDRWQEWTRKRECTDIAGRRI